MGIALPAIDAAVDAIVAAAIGDHWVALSDPDPVAVPSALRRRDGANVYRVAASDHTQARRSCRPSGNCSTSAGGATAARPSQRRLRSRCWRPQPTACPSTTGMLRVRDLATSGARLELALAPAGTGRTTAPRVLAAAWQEAGGTVVGLAPSGGGGRGRSQAVCGCTRK